MRYAFKSFQTRVTLAFVCSLMGLAILGNFVLYQYSMHSQFEQMRENLKVISQTAALALDADMLQRVPLNREGTKSQEYAALAAQLAKIKKANPPLKYIYTMAKTKRPGIWQFIVDPDPSSGKILARGTTSFPGDPYNVARFPEMLTAFEGPSADKQLTTDEWGATVSAYAPIYDAAGKAIAILGVDINANEIYAMQKAVRLRSLFILCVGILMSLALGFLISRRVSRPIKKLVEGTRKIAAGDLEHKVELKAQDEIGELANSFNEMAASLSESRKKLHEYFYRVVQSMVRSLEAKDAYTRGHSDRVSEYSRAIALEMGIPAERVDLLINAAQLHDIGKLGIHEDILNKKGTLSEDEWDMIHQHPVVGEDILKPVFLDRDMLTVVRSHHERSDGTGYPDRLKGGQISQFAQIVSVADAYDAMTSSRAYRQALTKEEAIARMRKDAGTQFDPHIVEMLMRVLEKE